MINSPIYKSLLDIPAVTIAIVGVLSITGGVYNYMKSVDGRKNRIRLFAFNTVTSFGIGCMVFLACAGYGINEVLSAGIASASAYAGVRTFAIVELVVAKKLGIEELEERAKDRL